MSTTSQPTPKRDKPVLLSRSLLAVAAFIFLIILLSALTPDVKASRQAQSTSTPIPPATPTFDLRRLDKPVIAADNTEQLKKGATIYWGVCLTCHGDRGQGMTTEWRQAYGDDSNCWQSGCHGSDHPQDSFFIPKNLVIPPVAGTGKLTRFKDAQELHDFILASMPWWDPGRLKDEEAWEATAYILKLQNVMPKNLELSDTNASAIMTQYAVPPPINDRPAILTLTGILALAAIGLLVQDLWKNKPRLAEKPNFIHHLHPPSIPALQARLRYTLGAGGLAVFLCLILLVTGILEMFYYIPVPDHAAGSVEVIASLAPFGALTRNLHFWSAQALMIVVSIHLLRVILTGAYARHRRLNYLIGVGMFVLVMLLDFTGYVLRWDEGIRWALVVGTNLLKTVPWIGNSLYQLVVGGSQPGLSSLERFYTWHIFVLTFAMIFFAGWHIFRVRRDGGVAVPPPGQRVDQTRISRFELLQREIVVMAIAGVILLFISTAFPAPIERPITQAAVDLHNARAPWFFLWVQQILKYGDPFLLGVAAPVVLLIVIAVLPYVFPQAGDREFGRWLPRGNRLAQIIIILIALIIVMLTIISTLPTPQL